MYMVLISFARIYQAEKKIYESRQGAEAEIPLDKIKQKMDALL